MISLIIIFASIIFFLLLLSALFSGSESAIFALSKYRFKYLFSLNEKKVRLLKNLHSKPRNLLSSILVGNLLVNITASSLFTMVVIILSQKFSLDKTKLISLEVIIMTFMILIFGEIIPKVIAVRNPEKFSLFVVNFINFFRKVFYPLTFPLDKISNFVIKKDYISTYPSDDEMITLVEIAKKQKVIDESEENILWNLVKLNNVEVGEIMTPRREMVVLDEEMTVKEAIDKTRKEKKSRYPVYKRDTFNITGWIHIKDILLVKNSEKERLGNLKREANFVPEVENAYKVFENLRKEGTHIAIVVDEFGETSGLVTLEDILEFIFGEIVDEYDEEEDIPIIRGGKGSYFVDGDMDIATLDNILRGAFSSVEFERISQLIYSLKGGIPDEGDKFVYNGVTIIVEEMDGNRVEKVKLEKK